MGAILDHLIKDHGATLEQAKVALKDWDIKELVACDRVIGEYMTKRNEIHFALLPECKGLLGRRAWIKDVLSRLLTEHDFLVTKLFHGDKQRRLIEFFGFKHTHSDAKYHYFWLDMETAKCWQ